MKVAIDRSTSRPFPPADGRRRALIGIGAGVTSLFLAPPAFGIAGVVLGVTAVRRGAVAIGWLAVALSVVFSGFSTWLALELVHRI
jgi:hypothetical protein